MSNATVARPERAAGGNQIEGSQQLVSFRLADEEFGLDIKKVREIIRVGEITRLPQTPLYVKGLINLRSTVIPVIDLKLRVGLPESERTDETRIMVADVGGRTIGVIVDSVSEVLRISEHQIVPPPLTVAGLGRDYFVGIARLEDRLVIVLDIEKVVLEETPVELAAN